MSLFSALLAAVIAALIVAPAAALADGPVTSAVTRAGKWMVDGQGRVVLVHGVDVVHKVAPYYPNNFTVRDARFLADEGFTGARIGFIWQGVEPQPGQYDDRYVGHVVAFNELLARYGIRTLVDFHQDAWSKSAGGDGAPPWATLGSNFLDDFQHFWDNDPAPDGVGIQTHFVNAWRHVAPFLDRSRATANILGLDPFNEPYAGTDTGCAPFTPCPPFEAGALADFYNRVIAGLRSVGDQHVIFPEGIAQNGIAMPSLPKFSDAQTAFTFHYYCPITQQATSSSPADASCPPLESHGVGNFVSYADNLDVPSILGEFSCGDANDDNANMVDLADRDLLSWTIWMYYDYAQDPANCPAQGLLVDDKKPGSEANAKQAKLDAIVVPYPQAIAGTPGSYDYDRSTGTMTLTYTARAVPGTRLSPRALTQIFVPRRDYPHGYRVSVAGARVVSEPRSPWMLLLARPGADVSVAIAPGSGSSTEMPLQACPAPSGRLVGARLGPLRLGMTRSAARRRLVTFAAGTRSRDEFCQFASPGIVAGYRFGRVATLLTANPSYAFGGVRTGARLTAAAMRRLHLRRTRRAGGGRWYRSVRGSTVGLVQVKRGVVTQVGIARKEI